MGAPLSSTKNGYITLISVLIMASIVVSITVSLLVIGINASKTSNILELSKNANFFAKSCIEEALNQINNSSSFTGSGSLNFTNGTCKYSVLNTGGQTRLVNATGTVSGVVRKLSVIINAITPKLNVSSSQEVSDF